MLWHKIIFLPDDWLSEAMKTVSIEMLNVVGKNVFAKKNQDWVSVERKKRRLIRSVSETSVLYIL